MASPYALSVAQNAITNTEVASGAGITVTKLAAGTFPTGAYSFSGSTVTFSGSGIWKSDGSVGIGTTLPGQKLTVVGNAQITGLGGGGTQMVVADDNGILNVQAIPGGGSPVSGSGSASRVAYWTSGSVLSYNTNFYWDNTNTRLGIGLSNPSRNLDINGTASVSGSFLAGSAQISGLAGGGTRMVTTDNTGAISAQAIPTGTVTGSGSANRVPYWTSASNISYNSNFYWDDTNTRLGIGLSNPSQNLAVAGSARVSGLGGGGTQMVVADNTGILGVQAIPTGTVTGSGSASRLAYWTTASNISFNTNLYWDNTNTRLGLGLSNPTTNLDVSGNARISGLGGGGTQMVVADNTGALSVQAIPSGTLTGSGSASRLAYWTTASNISFNTNLYWDNTNTRLGIGLSNPSYNLDVTGSARVVGTLTINATTDITTVSGQDLALMPNGAGQVGIGTTSPNYMLEVAGTLGLKSDGTNTGELKVGYTSSAPAGYYATYSP